MRTIRLFLFTILALLSTAIGFAQEVTVIVNPVQQVLPPQVLLYLDNPSKYFTITLVNNSDEQQDVYLTMNLEQSLPASGLCVITPSDKQPSKPFSVAAKATKTLTMLEMKTMFNHLNANDVKTSAGLFDDYQNGSFGLLPEGDYTVQITAYKWASPKLADPVVVSNPTSGHATFKVCYKAQAPQMLMPIAMGAGVEDNAVASLDVLNPMFTWTAPVVACNPTVTGYTYTFKVVEVLSGQNPDDAMEHNPVIYRKESLTVPQCMIPTTILTSQMYTTKTYAAQVTAKNTSSNTLNYTLIENDGKSTFRLFKLKTSDTVEEEETTEEKKDDDSGNDKEKTDTDSDDKKNNEGELSFEDEEIYGEIATDKPYTFNYPNIQEPVFARGSEARKMFEGEGMDVRWIRSSYIGGEGQQPDTVDIKYNVQLFCGDKPGDLQAALETEPIFSEQTDADSLSISWEQIKDAVEVGSYMVLCVYPVADTTQVAFSGDKTHIRDFALCEVLTKKYFQCSNMLDITNTYPTEKKAEDFIGQTIAIGQYQITIDEIKAGSAENTWQGKGHVQWKPFGFEVGVCVKFSDLKINTEDVVYAGTAETYSNEEQTSDIEVVDKLFSDWGIDHLISDTGIPYASQIQGTATSKAKDIAKQINLAKYYGYVKKGNAIYEALTTGKIKDVYMPLSIPKSINVSPVDIQIVSMKFAATYATMNILGEITLPNTQYTKNDILVLGAPRICISPDRLLPESGTVALLSDFTINDPKSSYEMTFNAPQNVIEPEDGCFVSWHDDKFEMLGIDIDMKIPGLVKDNNGTATSENAVFNAKATISDWDDWMAEVTIDPFQVSALPGWTFTASNIIYDHSFNRNSSNMGSFPKEYDKSKAGISNYYTNDEGKTYAVSGDDSWQGLYIKEIAIKFPKALEFGTSGDKRLNISASNMFFDKSGATLEVAAADILSAKTGKAGGWAFSLDKIYATFIQSNFSKCGFSGTFGVPLLKGDIGYECKIMRLTSNSSSSGQYAYVFKTQQTSGLSLDFFLAKATFKKDQTYFLLESVPTASGSMDTSCELVLGGDVTLGGSDYLNNVLKKKLKLNLEVPGAHFCGMRISNKNADWKSKYESELQEKAKNASLKGVTLYNGKEMAFGNSCYFNPGKWSLASDQKKLGAFDLSLSSWDFSKTGNDIVLYLQGKVSLVSGIDISAKCGVEIYATAKIPTSFSDIKNISLTYKETKFKDLTIDLTFSGMGLSGTLKAADKDDTEGYEGTLTFTMPGDLFKVDASGGYFKKGSGSSMYSYGWFFIKMGSKSGINIPPVQINSISGGFYYNCRKDGESATPQKGLIGVIAGLKMSTTAGEDALNAEVEMTVVYDSKQKRLSSFIFTGKVEAISGLVSAKANLVYENNSSSRYLQLDITVDASADSEKLTNSMTGVSSSLSTLKKQLNSSYSTLTKLAPEGSLKEVNDEEGTPDKSKGDSKGESLATAKVGATISLQFKITWREDGTTYSKPHWHLYLGEPSLDKRCTYTYLKFKSKIVSVDIGANGYVCVGNELPDNGKLPPIPDKVANFLNGSNSGKGIESASLAEANKGRAGSMSDFESQITKIGGGVMFGAQVYGYLDVDLGIFYLNAGATAGFDISIIKLPDNVYCTNFSGDPGYKGWYGYGQLYAYLYAKFGIRINLGFWKKDFDIADAGIGGLFSMQGPRPSHFEGKARVKLRLLGGLVNVDRRFSFECGQSCDLFYGNALDNFKLFGDLSIGYSDKSQGWLDSNNISPRLIQRPYFTTEAPLDEPFRVLDETEKARLAKNYTGNKDDLDMEASRTFIFRSNVGAYVTVKEYKSKSDKNPTTRYFYLKGRNRYANYLDITQLTPNRYYEMTVTGYAKEIQNGKEVNPVKYNESTKKYYNEAWSQSKTYYFCTGPSKEIDDNPSDLDEYVAIAYPSYYNQVKEYGGSCVTAYLSDIQYPNIAFYSDISKKVFQKGKLKWRLYKSNGTTKLSERDAKWVVGSSPKTCNLTVSSALTGVKVGDYVKLRLEYETSKTVNGKAQTETDNIVDLYLRAVSGDWHEGYSGVLLAYEKPFVGTSICSVTYNTDITQNCDHDIAFGIAKYGNGVTCKFNDPYTYIGYLSNYAFLGGWQFSSDRMDVNITTAQSCIYTDKGGVYEGKLGTGKHVYNIYNDWDKIRKLSTYTYDQYKDIAEYPLPELDDEKYNYTLSGLPRVPQYVPSKKNGRKVSGYINDLYSPIGASFRICEKIKTTLNYDFDYNINYLNKGKSWTNDMNDAEDWYADHRGQMYSAKFGDATLQIPAYQFPVVWGSCLDNSGAKKKVTAWGTLEGYSSADKSNSESRGHSSNALWIFSSLMGKENMRRTDGTFDKNGKNVTTWDNIDSHKDQMKKCISEASFDCYRLNTYDIDRCVYTFKYGFGGATPYERFTIKKPLEYYNNYDK